MNPRQILKKEELCIEDHAPRCMASCPVHVDSRQLSTLIKEENFTEAANLYKQKVLFPGIMAFGCHAPCKESCMRAHCGDAVEIGALERAAVSYGTIEVEPLVISMKLKKNVAVIGAGISGMTVATLLIEKGFQVSLYESEELPGGRAKTIAGVTPQTIEKDFFSCIDGLVGINYGNRVGKECFFADLDKKYDGIYVSKSVNTTDLQLELDDVGGIKVDPVTLQTSNPKVFAGGGTNGEGIYLPMQSLEEGKRAAISMDRFLKQVSVKAARTKEGPYETQLYTNLEGIAPNQAVKVADGRLVYTREEAVAEAERCLDCRCMECVKQCSFLAKYEKFPKKYIREVFNNLSTICIGFRSRKPLINGCSLCGLCEELCPNSLSMAEVFKASRQHMVKTDSMPPRYHEFPLRDMAFSNGENFSLCRHEPNQTDSNYLFFPGCQLAAGKPEYIKPMYDYFREKLTGGVGLMLGCCGAPADWAGREKDYQKTMEDFRNNWEAMGKPKIITACPTCYKEFKEGLPEAELTTAWNLYNTFGLPEDGKKQGKPPRKVSIHDACTARHEMEMQEDIRGILKKADYEVVELDYAKEKTRCCGYGGLMFYSDPDLVKQIREERRQESVHDLMTYCSVCRDYLADGEKPVYHILDVIYGKDSHIRGLKKGPNIDEKRQNRKDVKEFLLKSLWDKEWKVEKMEYETINLLLSEEVKKKMEERLILSQNIQEVIFHAEETGNIILNPKNGHSIAYFKPKVVTYWVEYEKEGEGYRVHSTYCHRIEIMEE